MNSAVATTPEIDDLDLAAQSLAAQIKQKLSLRANAVGIVYCDADVDVARLGERLHQLLAIDIVGLTTTAMMERHTGYNDMGILLCVLTADDTRFAVGCSQEMPPVDFAPAIKAAYAQAQTTLQEPAKFVLALSPYTADVSSELYLNALHEASGGIPVFGGVATDHYDLQYQKTFFNGQAFDRGLVFVLFGGNVKPIFAMEHQFGAKVEKKGIITESAGTHIAKMGDKTFKDFVSAIVPVPDEELVIFHFQSTPFVMELPDFEKGEQPVVRALLTVDHATGSGGFLGPMPEGSTIYLNVLERDNLGGSCNAAIASLKKQMAENADTTYSMIFITSCNGRHLLMGDTKDMESKLIQALLRDLPPAMNAMGFYAFGEFCPTGKRADSTAKNRYHNISFAVCAI